MRWTGTGTQLFSVRVDMIAPDDRNHWVASLTESLQARLPFSSGTGRGLVYADHGRGHEASRVVGLTFLLRADDFGTAATLAVETARAAGADAGMPGAVYDVVLVPEDMHVLRDGERDIPMPD